MARCEDYPCCGHENGCCPDFSADGQQLNMICTCGQPIPIDSKCSICDECLYDEAQAEYDNRIRDPGWFESEMSDEPEPEDRFDADEEMYRQEMTMNGDSAYTEDMYDAAEDIY